MKRATLSFIMLVAVFAVLNHIWADRQLQLPSIFTSPICADDNNQNDDGQKGQKDDGQQNQKDDGQQNQKDDGQKNQVILKNIDLKSKVVTLVRAEKGKKIEETLPFSKDLQILLNGKAGKLADLKEGMNLSVTFSKDGKEVIAVKQIRGEDGQQNQKNDGQKNQKNDGQKNQKNDGQKNQKNNGQKNQKNN